MMTEEQALKKWCPYADKDIPRGKWANDFDPERDACCIASDCMMWRWFVSESSWEQISKEIDATGENSTFEPIFGYCGLAGKPSDA